MPKHLSKSDTSYEDTGRTDLKLEEGESITLSPTSARFREHYKQFRPRKIDEVRKIIGLSEEAAKAAADQRCCRPSTALASIPEAEHLDSKEDAVRNQARTLAYQASAEYIYSANPKHLTQWTPVLDRFLEVSQAVLNVAFLDDIEVADGATLTISRNTHAVYARNVLVHRTGKIVCQGNVTFRINSLEGSRLLIALKPDLSDRFIGGV